MPANEQHKRWIFTKRSQYKTVKNTPENLKWIWDEDAFNKREEQHVTI